MTETKSFRDELEPEFARLLSFGISYSDLMEVLEHVEGELSWAIGMEVRGERYLRAAEAAWAENHPTSAAEHWRRATDCFFHAQLPLSCDPGFKQVLQQRSRHTYRRLAPLLAPAALPVAVPLTDDVALPGYLRTPRGARHACCSSMIWNPARRWNSTTWPRASSGAGWELSPSTRPDRGS